MTTYGTYPKKQIKSVRETVKYLNKPYKKLKVKPAYYKTTKKGITIYLR